MNPLRVLLCGFLVFASASASFQSPRTKHELVKPRLEQLALSSDFKITDKPTTREYNWTISMREGAPDGFYRQMLVVNGQYPGPTIEANEGDTIIVNVKNKLPHVGTSLHWHGLFQNGTAWMDGPAGITQCPIPSGGSFTYKFKIEGQYGTYWWHAHAGGQLSDGLHGALIVHSVNDPWKRGVHYDYDQILIMGDWYHNTSAEIIKALDTPGGYLRRQAAPPPYSAMFNGFGTWDCKKFGSPDTCYTREQFELKVYPNKKYRLRLINTASHGTNDIQLGRRTTLDVIEADDTPISSPEVNGLHRVQTHNGQRYSVILKTDQGKPGDAFWMRGEMNEQCFPYPLEEKSNTAFAVLRYIDDDSSHKPTYHLPTTKDWKDKLGKDCKDIEACKLVPLVRDDPPKVVKQQGIFNTQVGKQNTSDGSVTRFFVNHVAFEHLWYQPILHDVIEGWNVDNSNIMSMTFDNPKERISLSTTGIISITHTIVRFQHLYRCIITNFVEGKGALSIEDYKKLKFNTDNPLRRDTHVVPANSWAVLRVKSDIPGVWFLHCHIDWHLAHGFAAVVVNQPDVIRKFQLPESSKKLCKQIPPGLRPNSTSLGRRKFGLGPNRQVPRRFSYDTSKNMN
ncbi:Multicopper oxidase [Rhizoctonia solani]|uniref:Multicopper oxidase n=1 Tax=Rhizoctonia solani TaxID=456999 RepID=A0A8H8P2M5_9AGAM|nr:Multicopper oxidase [Rhizoctonia solani]QRW24035.1 Multicopper oxidase [Rhizoctonia solani]